VPLFHVGLSGPSNPKVWWWRSDYSNLLS